MSNERKPNRQTHRRFRKEMEVFGVHKVSIEAGVYAVGARKKKARARADP